VGVRALPTELRWKTSLATSAMAAVASAATRGPGAKVGRRTGDLAGGGPKAVSASKERARMPWLEGWAGRDPAAGAPASGERWSRDASDSGALAGAAASTGNAG